jgi:hypothetical protein
MPPTETLRNSPEVLGNRPFYFLGIATGQLGIGYAQLGSEQAVIRNERNVLRNEFGGI